MKHKLNFIEFCSTVQNNVVSSREKTEAALRYDKLLAYIDYRNAREALRKHVEFTNQIKTNGLSVLTEKAAE